MWTPFLFLPIVSDRNWTFFYLLVVKRWLLLWAITIKTSFLQLPNSCLAIFLVPSIPCPYSYIKSQSCLSSIPAYTYYMFQTNGSLQLIHAKTENLQGQGGYIPEESMLSVHNMH